MLILNEHHLRRTLTRYLAHYNTARPHRGIEQLSPSQAETGPPTPSPSWPAGSPSRQTHPTKQLQGTPPPPTRASGTQDRPPSRSCRGNLEPENDR
ncbi:hypothetical protein [Nonomuraea sp. NPDC049784]|uniref:hypothetical protein n=1 Tax=Nonomuraea sp. NPDC049784 TaxID=3154361 RepID=UPI0033F54A85